MNLKDDPLVLLGWSCPYCGNPTKLVEDSEIYGRSYGTKCYICEPCGAWVGCHKGTDKALGRIANKELRELKHQAHEAFDPIWKEGYLPRTAAYEVLSGAFELPTEQTHIGMFDEDMCLKVIYYCNKLLHILNTMQKILEQEEQKFAISVLQDVGFTEDDAQSVIEHRVKDAIHNVVAERLEYICDLFKRKEYSKIVEFIKFSESGGGPGEENFYISFKEITGLDDIGEVLERLDEQINLSKMRGY